MKRKHRRDYNHGKQGFVGGNPRYKRKLQNHWWDRNPRYLNDKERKNRDEDDL